MPFILTGFPFDLFLAIAIAFTFKPDLNLIYSILICTALIIPGFIIPPPHNIIFWSPGGAATLVTSTFILLHLFTNKNLFKDQSLNNVPDRKSLRSELLKINSIEQRQGEYVKMVVRMGNLIDKNNSSIIKLNTFLFLILFFLMFAVNLAALSILYLKTPDTIKAIFSEFFNKIVVSPGNFDEWFKSLLDLAPFQIFVANIMFVLLMIFIIDKVLVHRGLRQPAIGSPVYFKLPFFSLWIYIIMGLALFAAIELNAPPVYLLIAKNSFGIFSSLYIFQGLSLIWLYLQVRLLPAGSVITIILLTSFILPLISVFIFAILLVIGLLDFWIDLRKKALQPNLMSNRD